MLIPQTHGKSAKHIDQLWIRAENGASQGKIAIGKGDNPQDHHVRDAHVEEEFVAGVVHPMPNGEHARNVQNLTRGGGNILGWHYHQCGHTPHTRQTKTIAQIHSASQSDAPGAHHQCVAGNNCTSPRILLGERVKVP